MIKREKIAITGASGFIGQALVKHLESDNEILCVPRSYLYEPAKLESAINKFNPSVIIHLATAGNIYNKDDDDTVFVANIFSLYNLIRASASVDYKAFVYFSSSSVALENQTMYSITKYWGEVLSNYTAKFNNKPITICRPSSVTGIGEQSTHLIPVLIKSACTDKKIDFVENATHDFIDINDVVSAVEVLIENIDTTKGNVYNISTNKMYTNAQVKDIVEKVSGKQIIYNKVDSLREYDNSKWKVNNKSLKLLGWKPRVKLIDSVVNMYTKYKLYGEI